MKGCILEPKLLAIALECEPAQRCSKLRSGIIAGFYGIGNPCHFADTRCIEGALIGKEVHDLLLTFDKTTDEDTARVAVRKIFAQAKARQRAFAEETGEQQGKIPIERVPAGVLRRAGWEGHRREYHDPFTSVAANLRAVAVAPS